MAVTKEKKGQLVEKYVELLEKSNAAVFLRIAVITAVGGVVLLALVPLLKRMMHGVK